MTNDPSTTELHRRLEALEARFKTVLKRVTSGGAAPAHHRERIEDIESRASAVRTKLAAGKPGEEGSAWDSLKTEVHEDLNILSQALDR